MSDSYPRGGPFVPRYRHPRFPDSRFIGQPHPLTLADFWGLTPLHRRIRVGKMLTGDEVWSIKSLDDNEEEEVTP